jgi:hypothetical protein
VPLTHVVSLRRAVGVAVLSVSWIAHAEECPGVEVSFRGDRWTEAATRRLQAELEVEVRRSELCHEAEGRPRAQVRFVWDGREPIGVSVIFTRGQTERALGRRLEPAGLPADGLSLALAAVTGELLGEANVVLRPQAPPAVEAPVLAQHSDVSAPGVDAPHLALTARAAGEGWSGGVVQGGGDGALAWWSDRWGAELFVGGRSALVRDAADGALHAAALALGGSGSAAVARGSAWRLTADAGVAAEWAWFTTEAAAGWTGAPGRGWTLNGRLGMALAWSGGGLRWSLGAGVDVPLHALALTDGASQLEAIRGVGAYCALGGGWAW